MAREKTLADRLAALASENPVFEGKSRVLNTDGGVAEAMLDEVDASVLAVRLNFETGEGSLVLDVAGRRILAVDGASGSVSLPGDLQGTSLSMGNGDQLGQLAKLVSEFSSKAKTLKVDAQPAKSSVAGDGVSVAALRTAMGAAEAASKESPMDKMLAGCGDALKAALRLDGNTVAQTKGSIAHVQGLKVALSTQLEGFLDSRAKVCASHAEPSLTLCQETMAPGIGMGIAVIADERTLLAYDTNAVAKIYGVWKSVL